ILPKNIGVNVELKYPTLSEKKHYRLTSAIEYNKFVDTVLQTVYDSSSSNHHRQFMFSSFNPIICSAVNWKQPNYAVFFSTHGGYNKIRISDSEPPPSTRAGSKRKESVVDLLDSFPSPKHGPVTGVFSSLKSAVEASGSVDAVQLSPMSVTNSPPNSRSSMINLLQAGQGRSNFTWFHEEDKRCTSIKEAIKFARSNNMLGVICEATPLIQVPGLITNIKESGLILTSFGASNRDAGLVQLQKKHGVDAFMVLDTTSSSGPSTRATAADVGGNNSRNESRHGKEVTHATATTEVATTGLGLDLGGFSQSQGHVPGPAQGQGWSMTVATTTTTTTAASVVTTGEPFLVSDLEEGVFRYQNGIDS
ncbi:phosphate system positive regulatory protein pho81, partial [Gryganskiella cystojenkinii]